MMLYLERIPLPSPPNLTFSARSLFPPSFRQAAHWLDSHKAACNKQGEGGAGRKALPPPVSAATFARWRAACEAALDLVWAGRYAEARSSAGRVLSEMEGALGTEVEELLGPLGVIGHAAMQAGELGDSYTIMLRTLTISEKHFGEEGLVTCHYRSQIGATRRAAGFSSTFLPIGYIAPFSRSLLLLTFPYFMYPFFLLPIYCKPSIRQHGQLPLLPAAV